jgi:hypothetical protein
VPCANRGYHPRGTEIVRPSSSSTDNVSSVTVTLTILGNVRGTTAEGVPFMSQHLQILTDKAFNVTELFTTIAISQRDVRIKPELRALVLSIYVHVARLITIVRIEIETIRANS